MDEMVTQFTLLDRKGDRYNLRKKEVNEGSKHLGVHIAINGSQKGLVNILKHKADGFAE